MFAEAHDLGPDGLILNRFRSFGYSHVHGIPRKQGGAGYYGGTPAPARSNPRIAYWHHPGFAWAARREAIDALGGLFDVAVVGEADYIMAKSLVGEGLDVLYPGRLARLPQGRASTGRTGPSSSGATSATSPAPSSTTGTAGRRPGSTGIAARSSPTPSSTPPIDLKRDWQGLYQLVDHDEPRSILLRDAIRSYFRVQERGRDRA